MGNPKRSSKDNYPDTKIRRVNWSGDLATVRRFFREYREWVSDHRNLDPSAKSTVLAGLGSLDKQIAELPGAYGPPRGEILLACVKDEPVVCGALRELEPRVGEIKRIYVRADHRGPEFGKRFTSALLSRAVELGYDRVRVDTLPTMFAAIEFYQDLGFLPIPAYWPHPAPGALFFEYRVRKPSSRALERSATKSKPSSK
jgi:ribosomal protein S18 acetylase RimI-like enzyme